MIGKRTIRKPLRDQPLDETENRVIQEILSFLSSLNERDTIVMLKMSDEAKQIYDSYELEIENRIQEDLGIKEGYCGQLPNIVIRLACLYCISRLSEKQVKDCALQTLPVEKSDVEKAIAYTNQVWEWFGEVIELMNTSDKQRITKPELAKTTILELLADEEEHHYTAIAQYVDETAGVKQANVYVALKLLEKEGKIERTRPGYYKIKDESANSDKKT